MFAIGRGFCLLRIEGQYFRHYELAVYFRKDYINQYFKENI
jgi:hypothetical protein